MSYWTYNNNNNNNNNSVALVRERTIPTERQPLVGEVSANFLRIRGSCSQRGGSLRPYSRFYRTEPLFFLSSSSSFVLMRPSGPHIGHIHLAFYWEFNFIRIDQMQGVGLAQSVQRMATGWTVRALFLALFRFFLNSIKAVSAAQNPPLRWVLGIRSRAVKPSTPTLCQTNGAIPPLPHLSSWHCA
jgi:hypothetical protein